MAVIRKFARVACENAQPGSPLQMLRSKESHNPTMDHDVKNGQAVNKELLDEAITLLFAGQDTSAATLSWTLHLLSLYPNVQRHLAKEVREDLASMGHSCNEGITKRMISKMPLKLIRDCLAEHFDIRFQSNDIIWLARFNKPTF